MPPRCGCWAHCAAGCCRFSARVRRGPSGGCPPWVRVQPASLARMHALLTSSGGVQGCWSNSVRCAAQVPAFPEPKRGKTHWDCLLEEMAVGPPLPLPLPGHFACFGRPGCHSKLGSGLPLLARDARCCVHSRARCPAAAAAAPFVGLGSHPGASPAATPLACARPLAQWLAKEFSKERSWKLKTAKKYANAVQVRVGSSIGVCRLLAARGEGMGRPWRGGLGGLPPWLQLLQEPLRRRCIARPRPGPCPQPSPAPSPHPLDTAENQPPDQSPCAQP